MNRFFFGILFSLFSLAAISQEAPRSIGPSVNELIDDAANNFDKNKGEFLKTTESNDYFAFKNRSTFKCEEFIIVNKATKLGIYSCTFEMKDEKGAIIEDPINTMIAWTYNMEELGKKDGYKFERKRNDTTGFINKLYNEQGVLLAEVKHNGKIGSLSVFCKVK